MKRTIGILLAVTIFMTLLSGCAAGQSAENTPAPTEAPTATPAPATATPEPTPEVSEDPVYEEDEEWARELILSSESNKDRIYSIEHFFDLPVGRSTMLDTMEKGVHSNRGQWGAFHPAGSFTYFTANPDIFISIAPEVEYDALYYLNYRHEGLSTYDKNVNLEGTYVDENEIGIHEVTEEECRSISLDQTYTLQDFAWIKPGETTFEEVCKYTPTEDYFYFNTNEKVLCYPAEVPGAYFFISVNADDVVYSVANIWNAENDPEKEEFFTEEYMAEQQRKIDLILKEYVKIREQR
ncbi:MAG: hypothetical protein IJF56_06540 [Clostridia bacterium]|nr:hypothetical protein [Clostridia bacterium]